MKGHLYAILTVGLFACGGSQAGDSRSGGARSGDSTPATATGGADVGADDTVAAEDSSTETPDREPSDAGEFEISEADRSSRPTQTKVEATETQAAVRFFVVDKDKGPIEGIVISLTGPTGEKYYTEETDSDGFAEVLVPNGTTYSLVYLSLGRRNVAAKVEVADKPNLNMKLTMRYQREEYATGGGGTPDSAPRFVLDGVQFDTGKATLTSDSHARLETVVEYMTHKKSARIEISGHTDNVGKKKDNKRLSQKRADAVRAYLVSKGIDAGRIETVGYGDERPVASNDSEEGRQKNRRIEATEL
jgi:outer membrane protein OmpA-like peptidoglycan-associated protein